MALSRVKVWGPEILYPNDLNTEFNNIINYLNALQDVSVGASPTFNSLTLSAAGALQWSGRTKLDCSADGLLRVTNSAGTSFGRIQLGGTTASYPSLKANGANLEARAADDSAGCDFTAKLITASNGLNILGGQASLGTGVNSFTTTIDTQIAFRSGTSIFTGHSGQATFYAATDNSGIMTWGPTNTELYLPNIGTTGSTANAFIAAGSGNLVQRSTSSMAYKHRLRDITLDESLAVVRALRPKAYRSLAPADDPDQEFLGLTAEDVHEIDPRLVSYTKAKFLNLNDPRAAAFLDRHGIDPVREIDFPVTSLDGEETTVTRVLHLLGEALQATSGCRDAAHQELEQLIPEGVNYDRAVLHLTVIVQHLLAEVAALKRH